MDDTPDPADIPVPAHKREETPRQRPRPVAAREDESGPDASEAPEEEGSATRRP